MDYSDFTVVLPTLNEEGTIGLLISKLTKSYKGLGVIVVDDGSRDNTKGVVNSLSKSNRNIKFIDRSKDRKEKGLTASAAEGILASRTKFAIVMDADMQHPPDIFGRVAKKLDEGCELVVATRADVSSWKIYRKIISKVMISLGWLILVVSGKERCGDIFSGFFGVERKLFEDVYKNNRNRFIEGGYKVLFDFLKCMKYGTIAIGEVPYSFGVRKYGSSKAGFRQGAYLFKSFFT